MKARTATVLLGILAFLGLIDSLYLTWDHLQALSDPAFGGGICGAGGGCDISRHSAASEIPLGHLGPGMPIAIAALGFYVAFLLLIRLRARRSGSPHAGRIMLALAAMASGYSISLGVLSLVVQGSLCPLCTVLYIVNLALFGVAIASASEPFLDSVRGIWRSILTRAGAIATLAFVVVVVGVYGLYAMQLDSARADGVMASASVEVNTEGRPLLGPADAPVHIIEFADLQCPHCRVLFDTLEAVQAKRPTEVKVSFMHFPLDDACNRLVTHKFHQRACELAKMADCAGRQGHFFDVAGALMKSQHGASEADLAGIVKGLGVNMVQFDKCVADPATEARIKADIEQGLKLDIKGTPVFLVNGHKVSGARPADTIDALIDKALRDGAR